MKARTILLCALAALFVSAEAASQTAQAVGHDFKFRTLSPPDGLSFDGVNDVEKDGDGFVWVLLGSNLYRFDGYEYKHYYSFFSDNGNTSRLLFHDLDTDSRGRLLVSCAQGLFRYNRSTDSFTRLADKSYMLFVDSFDNIWTTPGGQLCILRDVDSLEFVSYNDRRIYNVGSAVSTRDGSFLVATAESILRYDHAGGEFSEFYSFPAGHTIRKIQSHGDKLWVLTQNHGLEVIDLVSRRLEETHELPPRPDESPLLVRDMLVDSRSHVWVASIDGLVLFDPPTEEWSIYRHSESDIFSIPHNSVRMVKEDADGNVWIGTFSGGLSVVDPDESKSFTTFVPRPDGLNRSSVSAFAEDDHAFWIGTEGGGVNRLEKSTGRWSYLTSARSLSREHVKSLVIDGHDRLWIATFTGGLVCRDIRSGAFRRIDSRSPESERLLANDLRKIIVEGDRGLWIAYQNPVHAVSFLPFDGSGISHFGFDTGGLSRYNMDICRDGDFLWIITQQSLYRMDVGSGEIENMSAGYSSFLNAQSLGADRDGNVWVGTVSGLLVRFDPVAEEFTAIAGLADYGASSVFSICFDKAGDLWMGTDNGLFRYSPQSGKFTRFDASDGAQGRMYNPLAAMLTASGELLFGGTNGFSIVDPRGVTESRHVPKPVISDFTVNNEAAVPRFGAPASGTWWGSEVVLSHRETGFGFRLATDDHASAGKARYRYQLDGYDSAPVTITADSRTVNYANVKPGKYRFSVLASSDGETWSAPVSVTVVRRPAPWNSRAAWTVYVLAAMTVAGVMVYLRIKARRLAMRVYLDGLEKQKQQELHQSQLRFFTNISHDFRTPLSLILGAVDNLGQRDGRDTKYWRVLRSNSQRLLGLVNELMDFRKVENGMMGLQVKPTDVNALVAGIAVDFAGHAGEKNIDFRVECDPAPSARVPVDRAVVEKIVINLLNNAIKYTPRGGRVVVSTLGPGSAFISRWADSYRIAADKVSGNRFTIAVSDTGVGISRESIAKVFERFYKVNTENSDLHLGTGIGLALVKSLVLLHRGAITIFSERDRGTDMVVELPAAFEAYPAGEIVTNDTSGGDSRTPPPVTSNEGVDLTQTAAESMLMRSQRRLLLVEDNDELREMIADFLSADYEVAHAVDGQEASEWLSENEADMIVSDIMMPRKDGVELCREVKGDVGTSHIPFVMLTAKTDLESKLESTDSGADLYFEKPVDLKLLSLAIANIFNRQSKLREHYAKNYFVESTELAHNEHDNAFLKKLIDTIDSNLTEPVIDVEFIASELSMSSSKLYYKMKALTGITTVEFILRYRLRKAARFIIEEDMTIGQVMEKVGIKSQSYFSSSFKKEFGQTPSAFAKTHSKRS